jgi:hypothetical protein
MRLHYLQLREESKEQHSALQRSLKKVENSNMILRGQMTHHLLKLREKQDAMDAATAAAAKKTDVLKAAQATAAVLHSRVTVAEDKAADADAHLSTLHAANVDLTDTNLMLSHQIKELMRLAKRNDETSARQYFERTVREMDADFDEKRVLMQSQSAQLRERKERINKLTHGTQELRLRLQEKELEIGNMRKDLYVFDSVRDIRSKYPLSDDLVTDAKRERLQSRRVDREFGRQTATHQKNLTFAKHQLRIANGRLDDENSRNVEQNTALMEENSQLRRQCQVSWQSIFLLYHQCRLLTHSLTHFTSFLRCFTRSCSLTHFTSFLHCFTRSCVVLQ